MMHFRHLPTVELQALAWALQVRQRKQDAVVTLNQGGYQATLTYFHQCTIGERMARGVLQVEAVHVPPEFRGRDWLPRFCQLCQIMTDDALLIRSPDTPRLHVTMARWGFSRVGPDLWVVYGDEPGKDWPFQLDL